MFGTYLFSDSELYQNGTTIFQWYFINLSIFSIYVENLSKIRKLYVHERPKIIVLLYGILIFS